MSLRPEGCPGFYQKARNELTRGDPVSRNGIFKIIAHSEWGIALALLASLVRIEFGYDRDWGRPQGALKLLQLSKDSSLRIQ
jgi:hypothetical protein